MATVNGYEIKPGADLRGADLEDADLRGADLEDADLQSANLRGADLRGADLEDADLRDANLQSANLRDANLRYANLRDANLQGVILQGAHIPTGETFEKYLAEVVPAFLAAGGRALADASPSVWDYLAWSNRSTAFAFGRGSLDGVPLLLIPRAEQFIQLWDNGVFKAEVDSDGQVAFVPSEQPQP